VRVRGAIIRIGIVIPGRVTGVIEPGLREVFEQTRIHWDWDLFWF